MKNLLAVIVLAFSSYSTIYCQFQKEAEYPSSELRRILLQDGSEKYFYIDEQNSLIKIADNNHQLIDSIPHPFCEGTMVIESARSDFEDTEIGVLCYCRKEFPNIDSYLLDKEGNLLKEFYGFPRINDKYTLDFDPENGQTLFYNTQSLELEKAIPGISLSLGSEDYHDKDYYYGYNGRDSIFVFDEDVNVIVNLQTEAIDSNLIYRLTGATIVDNNQTSFYFILAEIDTSSFQTRGAILIDEDGKVLEDFGEDSAIFHKHQQNLSALNFSFSGIDSYNIIEDNSESISNQNSGVTTIKTNSRYAVIKYANATGLVEFLDYKLDLINLAELETNLSTIPYPFFDHNGNEYFWFSPLFANDKYCSIYKGQNFLQRIDNMKSIRVSNIENHPTKLLAISSINDQLTEVYSLNVSNTNDLFDYEFSISPNPVMDRILIQSDIAHDRYTIYDGTGKQIQSGVISGLESSIEVNRLGAGVYYLILISDGKESVAKKFIRG